MMIIYYIVIGSKWKNSKEDKKRTNFDDTIVYIIVGKEIIGGGWKWIQRALQQVGDTWWT